MSFQLTSPKRYKVEHEVHFKAKFDEFKKYTICHLHTIFFYKYSYFYENKSIFQYKYNKIIKYNKYYIH